MDCRCSFKAFGVILLHFKVDKMNFFLLVWGTPTLVTPEITGKTRFPGIPGKFSSRITGCRVYAFTPRLEQMTSFSPIFS
jgi:hypothetical protein